MLKTILVVFTASKLSKKKIYESNLKKYVFVTEEDVQEGDMIYSESYGNLLQVVNVIEEGYKFFNSLTGELRNDINSTACKEIKKIVFQEPDDLIVYGNKLDRKDD